MNLFIRPVYTVRPDGTEQLLSIAVCTTNGPVLVDEQILEHFSEGATGKEIKEEFPTAEWGNSLEAK